MGTGVQEVPIETGGVNKGAREIVENQNPPELPVEIYRTEPIQFYFSGNSVVKITIDDKRHERFSHKNKSINFTGCSYVFMTNEKIAITGGNGRGSYTNVCQTYNYCANTFNEWTEAMKEARAYHCSYILSNAIYVFGGDCIVSAEYYSTVREKWALVKNEIPVNPESTEFS
jgi:hypothetical protein